MSQPSDIASWTASKQEARNVPLTVGSDRQDALNSDARLADALHKCIALGGQAGSEDLRAWASRELKGYSGDDELPEYRVVTAAIALDGMTAHAQITGQRVPSTALPDFVREKVSERLEMREPIGEIEELARRGTEKDESVKASLPMGADIAAYMNSQVGNPFQHIESLYWKVSPTTLFAIVDRSGRRWLSWWRRCGQRCRGIR